MEHYDVAKVALLLPPAQRTSTFYQFFLYKVCNNSTTITVLMSQCDLTRLCNIYILVSLNYLKGVFVHYTIVVMCDNKFATISINHNNCIPISQY